MRKQVFSVVPVSRRAQQYHWQIYDAVARGAAAEAHGAMEGHLNEMETYIRSSLETDRGPQPDVTGQGRQRSDEQ
jgi:DNA-binding FadR family transcriptional regulator